MINNIIYRTVDHMTHKRQIKKALKKFKAYRPFLEEDEYNEASSLFEELLYKTPVVEENRSHCYKKIFPLISIYKVLKDRDEKALELSAQIFNKVEVESGVKFLNKFLKIPFVYKIIPRLVNRIVRRSYIPSADGFQMEFLETSKQTFRMNITQCPYYNYCKAFGVPELTNVFCTSDEIVGEALKPHILFKREQTLGRGGKYCDFCYSLKKPEE